MSVPISLAPQMLLAIDTCGSMGGVALGRVDSSLPSVEILATAELVGRTYSSLLVSSIEEVMQQAAANPAEIAAIIVVHGPGSFTGVRVGVSAAKGLAEGLQIPVIALSRLELLACSSRGNATGSACAALDAGRGEFYFGRYPAGSLVVEALQTRDELVSAVSESGLPLVVCEAIVRERLQVSGLDVALVAAPTASDALTAGAERFHAEDFADVATLDGNYLRRPYAEDGSQQPKPAAQ